MVYSDAENARWWADLSKQDRAEILATMIEKATDPSFALSLSRQYDQRKDFSPKQLAAIRKWAP
jgi:hypothetical protein